MAGIQRIADDFDLTPRMVQLLAKEGMPKAGRGDYDEVECLRWYVRYLRQKMKMGATDTNGEPSGRERLDLANAGLKELELARELKQTLTVEIYERAHADLITPARLELLAIEARLRPAIGADHAARCGSEIRRALRDLAHEEASA